MASLIPRKVIVIYRDTVIYRKPVWTGPYWGIKGQALLESGHPHPLSVAASAAPLLSAIKGSV